MERTASGVIACKAALIGDELALAEHVELEWKNGTFTRVDQGRGSSRERDVIAVPAFTNAHVHSGDGFMKDAGFHLSLEELVAPPSGLKHRMLEKTPPAIVMRAMTRGMEEMARGGTRAFVDFREGGLAGARMVLEASQATPAPQMARVLARPGEEHGSIDDLVQLAIHEEMITGFNTSSPSGHADDVLETIATACNAGAGDRRLAFGTHVGETAKNAARCQSRHGTTDVERALEYFGHLGRSCVLVHCNHVDDKGIQAIGDAGAGVVLCPGTAMLFSNVASNPPYKALMESGATCALGTDNVMINAPDMFQALNQFTRLVKMQHPRWKVDPAAILAMTTVNPARIAGEQGTAGSISRGKDASFFLLDTSDPAFHGVTNPVLAILLRSHPGLVTRSWTRGEELTGSLQARPDHVIEPS